MRHGVPSVWTSHFFQVVILVRGINNCGPDLRCVVLPEVLVPGGAGSARQYGYSTHHRRRGGDLPGDSLLPGTAFRPGRMTRTWASSLVAAATKPIKAECEPRL